MGHRYTRNNYDCSVDEYSFERIPVIIIGSLGGYFNRVVVFCCKTLKLN